MIHRFMHPNKMSLFGCPHCRATFAEEFRMNAHMSRMHPGHANDKSMPPVGSYSMMTRKRFKIKTTMHPGHANDKSMPSASHSMQTRKKVKTETMYPGHVNDEPIPSASLSAGSNFTKTRKQFKTEPTKRTGNTKIVYANELSCSYCPKFFANARAKSRHEKIHTGKRTFFCKFCSASFLYKRTGVSHEAQCHRLRMATWCRFCDFYTFMASSVESHYKNMHGFQFTSDEEKNFLRNEINRDVVVKKDEECDVFKGYDRNSSEYENKFSQLNYNLEEIFRDHILVPKPNSFEGTGPENGISIEDFKDQSSICVVRVSLPSDKVEEMVRHDDLEPKSGRVEDASDESLETMSIEAFEDDESLESVAEISSTDDNVEKMVRNDDLEPNSDASAGSPENIPMEASKGNESPERETQISPTNDNVEKMVQDDDLEPNSGRVEDASAASPENIPMEASKGNESSERESEISQSNDNVEEMVQDENFEPNSRRVEDASTASPKSVPINDFKDDELEEREIDMLQPIVIIQDDILESNSERFDDAVLQEDTITEVSNSNEQSNRDVEIPPSKDAPEISRDNILNPVSKFFENVSFQNNPVIDALENNSENSRSNDPSSKDGEDMPEPANPKIELEANIEPNAPSQDAEDSIDEKLIKYEIEVAQLNDNLREIFRNDTFESSESLEYSYYNSEPNRTYQVIDLTLNNDDDEFIEPRIIVIDDDD
ncbi:hypothetical protein U1Q18_049959 [Sarracenia purpurea var. burkii]